MNQWYTDYNGARDDAYGGGLRQRRRRQQTGRERYWEQVRELQERLGISHMEARNRWSQYYNYGGTKKRAIKRLVLSVRASTTDKKTCPFCRDAIYPPEEGGPDFICPACQAHYHLDCFEDELGGRCATLGCSTRRVINRARQVTVQTRGRRTPDVTPATPITRARNDGATAQEVDPEDYRQQQQAARASRSAQEPSEAQDTPEPRSGQQAPRESFWRRSLERVLDPLVDNPGLAVLLATLVVMLLTILFQAILG